MSAKSKPRLAANLFVSPEQAAVAGRGPELPAPIPDLSPAAVSPPPKGGGIKASTVGMTVYLLPSEAKRLRRLAIDVDRSAHDLILDGIDRMLAEHGQPPLARYQPARGKTAG